MHEIYLAEQIINETLKRAKENKAQEILEVNIAIPEDEHFTESEFKNILKMQAEGTLAEKTNFRVLKENTKKPYIEDIKIK
jgi:Zn finger protein HypA/HybF involved in hydrogenase expression